MENRFQPSLKISRSEKAGAWHWLAQRISGVLLIFLGGWLYFSLFNGVALDYCLLDQWVSSPVNSILLTTLFLCLAYHLYLGLEVIVDDYIHISFWHSFTKFLLKLGLGLLTAVFIYNFYLIIF